MSETRTVHDPFLDHPVEVSNRYVDACAPTFPLACCIAALKARMA